MDSSELAYLAGATTHAGTMPVGTNGIRYQLATGKIDLVADTIKLAVVGADYTTIGTAADPLESYDDIADMTHAWVSMGEATNPLYPAGGVELTGLSVDTDTGAGVTTFSWDDVTFESEEYEEYFSTLYVAGAIIITAVGVIYDDTADGKPIILIFPLNPFNYKHFLSSGEKHTITNIQVRI